jgi:hypothetical protein
MTFGFDINPWTISDLIDKGLFLDPFEHQVEAACFWDVLEHFPDPSEVLERVKTWVFLSIPLFANMDHAKKSKHFKPGEHLWYFTHDGIVDFMSENGFGLKESNSDETKWREDIGSYAFKRKVL